jgi:hypothetical protein
MFIVEHCLASLSYWTCQDEFGDTFPFSHVPEKYLVFYPVDSFRILRQLLSVLHHTREGMNAYKAELCEYFQHVMQHCFLFSNFNVI